MIRQTGRTNRSYEENKPAATAEAMRKKFLIGSPWQWKGKVCWRAIILIERTSAEDSVIQSI